MAPISYENKEDPFFSRIKSMHRMSGIRRGGIPTRIYRNVYLEKGEFLGMLWEFKKKNFFAFDPNDSYYLWQPKIFTTIGHKKTRIAISS